jgi:tryptophan 2,3-dioxygenase
MNENVLLEKLRRLEKKYEASGQNLESYLDGLYEADFLNYWDYLHVDTLLSLQVKRTTLPDEEIFIIYHQVTELYFKLVISALEQICFSESGDRELVKEQLRRVVRYFDILMQSFRMMSEGMQAEQFMRFRMALLPSSGFQSVQFRLIEMMCTSIDQLQGASGRAAGAVDSVGEKLDNLYWRFGSTDLASGKKTLTLTRFEDKYNHTIAAQALKFEKLNLNHLLETGAWGNPVDTEIRQLLRELDHKFNVNWRNAHLRAASRYLKKAGTEVSATGGTNWTQYLPPRFQKIIFFPSLWEPQEKENWGIQEN